MNNRHRRVAKLRKQELNVLKAKFEKEYGVSVEEVYK
ncbi:toxin PIN, partial [Enterococcus sp. E4-185]|nr:toxin PIN [Enterococcus sp. E4-185]